MIGRTVSHYKIIEQLGAGGMGIVYKARDTKLDRMVALKFLPHHTHPSAEDKSRFLREAKSISALDHPNICTIHEIDEANDGQMFIVMGFYAGESLAKRLTRGPLAPDEAINIAIQIARGLSKAHASNVIHRDIKPANIIITEDGDVRLVDFGLAKLLDRTQLTGPDVTVGTVAYMSPEQAQGHDVDHRTDLWALGVVLYEMLTGKAPFTAENQQAVLYQIINKEVTPMISAHQVIPPALAECLVDCLQKSPDARPSSAEALVATLERMQPSSYEMPAQPATSGHKRSLAVVTAVIVIATLVWAGSRFMRNDSDKGEVRANLYSQVRQLIGERKGTDAYALLEANAQVVANDPALIELLNQCSREVEVESDPPGATVYFRDYLDSDGEWSVLGTTPVTGKRLPYAFLRLRFEKDGFQTREISGHGGFPSLATQLVAEQDAEPGMTHIPGGWVRLGANNPVELPDYWLDTYEVTNKQYQQFVDAGGYRDEKYWQHAFIAGDDILSWAEAMALFQDATGQTGPAQWELGRYPQGRADYPVGGVSWYEAAAYLEFAGKELPTLYHWRHAAGYDYNGDILLLSNFEASAAAPVGTFRGLSPFGNYDMAGNIQEWCWNEIGGRRYSMGGDWSGAMYAFMDMESQAQAPVARLATLGFRGMKTTTPYPAGASNTIESPTVDYAGAQPVADDLYAVYRQSYDYDRTDLDARVESVSESEHWRKEKISFKAAYGQERVPAYLFLPRGVDPPYQTVVWFPGGGARSIASSEYLTNVPYWDFVVQSGRAVLYPVYQNTYERQMEGFNPGPNQVREVIMQWAKDVQRSVDYLESRPDIDSDKLAYYSLSLGSTYGPIFTAVEPRFQCSILLSGGLFQWSWLPDVMPLNFLPRSTVPTLMVNGRYDFGLPLETSVKPMLALLGTPEEDKQLYVIEGDHIPRVNDVVRVTLDWLDRYLGPTR